MCAGPASGVHVAQARVCHRSTRLCTRATPQAAYLLIRWHAVGEQFSFKARTAVHLPSDLLRLGLPLGKVFRKGVSYTLKAPTPPLMSSSMVSGFG